MTFLNKKEDVIKIELTPYGRHLLSLGKMEPVYYSFFDDAIAYDVGTETQSEIKKRILEETPYLKPFYCFTGVEQNINTEERENDIEMASYPVADTKADFMNYPLGTSANTSGQYSPAWEAVYLQGTASSATKILGTGQTTAPSLSYRNIPQLNSEINYRISVENTNNKHGGRGSQPTSPNKPISLPFSDGTYLQLREEQNLVYLLEQNGFQHFKSFEIEIFLYDESNNDNLIPLKFLKRKNHEKVEEIGLLGGEFDSTYTSFPQPEDITPNTVEYYLDFRVDKTIPTEDICVGLETIKVKDILLDVDYECPERLPRLNNDVYRTRVEEIEDCD